MRSCLKCKTEYCPLKSRSFHVLPNDVELRNKWTKILDLPISFKAKKAYICSDHFSSDSFEEDEVGRCRKRLRRGAIPMETGVCVNVSNESNGVLPHLAVTSSSTAVPIVSASNVKEDTTDQISSKLVVDEGLMKDCQSISESLSSLNKKKLADQIANEPKEFTYMDGNKVEYFTRSDFSSDEAWLKFIKFKRKQDSRVAEVENICHRHKKNIEELHSVVEHLEAKNESSAEKK